MNIQSESEIEKIREGGKEKSFKKLLKLIIKRMKVSCAKVYILPVKFWMSWEIVVDIICILRGLQGT